jgi:histidyl-tRNA synthetase
LFDVRLNSLGHPRSARPPRAFGLLRAHAEQLDSDARRRLHNNPLRILDTKNPAMALVEGAPRLFDHLGKASLEHFDAVRAVLDAVGQPYRINPRLVRGMDYYNLTVFEWITDKLGAQGTICGGGRYDGLFELIGGKPAPAWAGAWHRTGARPAAGGPDA